MDQNFAWLFLEAAIFFSICFHNFVLMKRLKIWNNAHNTPFSLWKAWICLLYKWWLIHDPNKVLNISYKQWQWLKERKSFNQSSFLSFFFLSVCVTSQNCFFCPNSYRVEGYQALPTVEQTVLRGRADSARFPQPLGSITVTARYKIRTLLLAEG